MLLHFVRASGITGRLISFWEWGYWTHVEAYVPDDYYKGCGLLGAQLDGVKIRDLHYEKVEDEAWGAVKTDALTEKKVFDFLFDQLGKPYDVSVILGFFAHRDWHKDNAWTCSELIAAAFDAANYPLLNGPMNRVTPNMLADSPWVLLPPGTRYK